MKRYSSGSEFEHKIGYSRVVDDGHYVHVSGTTGYDYSNMTIAAEAPLQAEQCLRNIENALSLAGCSREDVVRVRYLFVDRADFAACQTILKEYFGPAPPAATLEITGLYDLAMKLEIEVTARSPSG